MISNFILYLIQINYFLFQILISNKITNNLTYDIKLKILIN